MPSILKIGAVLTTPAHASQYVNQGLMREWPAPQPHNRDKIASPATMQLTEILRTLGDVQAGPTGLSPEQDALPQRDAHDAKRK